MEVNRYCLLLFLTLTSLWISLPQSSSAQGLKSQQAFDLVLPDKNGQNIQLKDLKGKYVLLHFWASWCPNSAIALPNMKSIYEKYKTASFETADGFDIFSVSLDTDENKWKEAMRTHQIDWKNCIDTRGFDSPLALSYKVWYTPVSFLVDPNGVIVAENPSFSYLDNLLGKEKVEEKISYKIQIGKFPILKFHNFAQVKELGNMEIEKDVDGQNLVLIGAFDKKSTADYIAEQAVEQGYKDAYIVAYKQEERLAYLPKEEIDSPTNISEPYVKFTDEIVFSPAASVSPTFSQTVEKPKQHSTPNSPNKLKDDPANWSFITVPLEEDKIATAPQNTIEQKKSNEVTPTPYKEEINISKAGHGLSTQNYPFSPSYQKATPAPVQPKPLTATPPQPIVSKKDNPKKEEIIAVKEDIEITPSVTKEKKQSEALVANNDNKPIMPYQPFADQPTSYSNIVGSMSDYKQALKKQGKLNSPDSSSRKKDATPKKRSTARIVENPAKTTITATTAKPGKTEFEPWPKSTTKAPVWDGMYNEKRKSYEQNNWQTEDMLNFDKLEPKGREARRMKRKKDKLQKKRAKLKAKVKSIHTEERRLKEAITVRSMYGD